MEKTSSEPEMIYTLGDLGKLIYNRNPFYIISALLVLYGQTLILNTHDYTINTWIPVFVLGGYTLLLTVTALFIVKKGEVWDDAQSILGVILVLLLVISVSFDGETMDSLGKGIACLGGSLAFSVGILELLRHKLGIRLARNFITGGYAILGLFFVYPLIVSQLILQNPDNREPALWGILLFPVVMGLALFLWLPSAWLGRRLGRENGTPWRNPRFPWSIGVIAWLGILARTFLLTLSYQGGRGEGGFRDMNVGFGIYMLIPPVLCALILAAEYARASYNDDLLKKLLIMPVILLILGGLAEAAVSVSSEYRQFSQLIFVNDFRPWMLGVVSALIFYIYAWLRKFEHADLGVAALTLFAIIIMKNETCYGGVAILLVVYLCNRSILRFLALSCGILASIAIIMWNHELAVPVLAHAGTALIMLGGLLYRSAWLKYMGTMLWLTLYGAALLVLPRSNCPPGVIYAYFITMCTTGMVYCYFGKNKFFRVVMYLFPALGGAALAILGHRSYLTGKTAQVIFWAAITFAGAFGISMHKARKRKVK